MTTFKRWHAGALIVVAVLLTHQLVVRGSQGSDEDVARRQLESGRAFTQQGNFAEALRDFRAVAERHASSAVADDALLEIARYFFDVVGDTGEATLAAEKLLESYPTSDTAPDAYLMMGRLAMARSHQPADITAALASFERVTRLFPNSPVVPDSLLLSGEALNYAGRFDDALANLVRIEVEFPDSHAAPAARLLASQVLTARGDATAAMEELQQVRNQWPLSKDAEEALGLLTILHRHYVRTPTGTAVFAPSPNLFGPAKLQNVNAMAASAKGAVYWATETGLDSATTNAQTPPPARPRGLARDNKGDVWAIEIGAIRPFKGPAIFFRLPRQNDDPELVKKIAAVAQLSNGDWLVADEDERIIHRFKRGGEHAGVFAQAKVSRLAVNALDQVLAIERDQKGLMMFDATGRGLGRIAAKTASYNIENAEDLTFDVFGHLYVLDRESIVVFTPFASAAGAGPTSQPTVNSGAVAARRPPTFTMLSAFAESERSPNAFRRATSFTLDSAGTVYLYDERAERIRVYR